MKKLFAIVLTLALALSFSAAAFAAGSPVTVITVDSLPAESEAVEGAETTTPGARIIPNKDLTKEQEADMNKVFDKVVKEGDLPVDSFAVETTEKTTVIIELDEEAVVYVVYPDGTLVKFLAKELVVDADGRREIPVDSSCKIVIAKAA